MFLRSSSSPVPRPDHGDDTTWFPLDLGARAWVGRIHAFATKKGLLSYNGARYFYTEVSDSVYRISNYPVLNPDIHLNNRLQSRDDRESIRVSWADPSASTDDVGDSSSDTFGALPQMITQKGDAGSVRNHANKTANSPYTSSSVIAGMRTVGRRRR